MNSKVFRCCGKDIRRVGFLGFGKSNRGIFEYLCKHYPWLDFTVRARDAVADIPKGIKRVYFGGEMLSFIDEDIIFLSPSARRECGELTNAKSRGVILSSDAELFFERSRSGDIYAVTGSDGKSTTTYLTAELLKRGYERAIPCGNFGEALAPHIDDADGAAYVTELSSFQLTYLLPRSKRCVITNITENHLDWHGSFSEYINAKRRILDGAKERIFNFDCDKTRDFIKDYGAFAVYSCEKSESELRRLVGAEIYLTLLGDSLILSGEKILNTRDIRVGGRYNIYNYMAAILMSYGIWEKDDVVSLARRFTGLAHRFETVGIYGGVRYVNSSIDSSPARTSATLSVAGGNIILILGGRSKGLDYKALIPAFSDRVKSVIAVGECGQQIMDELLRSESFLKLGIPFTRFDRFFDGVDYAIKTATHGDTVLLSPASTSYDEFKNFEERGSAFSDYIKQRCK